MRCYLDQDFTGSPLPALLDFGRGSHEDQSVILLRGFIQNEEEPLLLTLIPILMLSPKRASRNKNNFLYAVWRKAVQ